ncbi:hypothetical protein B23_0991 [Geobacillus thermoleovorans B23]|nr:hypothetical protein B23_0991 [Geobacillus thermoleovorans B23]
MVAISLRVGDNVSYDSCTYIRNLTGYRIERKGVKQHDGNDL